MAAPKIAAVATATPPYRFDQAHLLGMAGYGDAARRGLLRQQPDRGPLPLLRPGDVQGPTPNETVDELNERFRRGAVELGTRRVRAAVAAGGLAARGRGLPRHHHLHGPAVPEPRRPADPRARAAARVQRVHVGDTGCASAMVALQQAWNHLRAFPRHRAVMVAVEICSAAYFLDDRLESAVAHAIFADGAGALALSRDGPGRRSSRTARCSAPSTWPPWASSIRAGGRAWCSPRTCGASAPA